MKLFSSLFVCLIFSCLAYAYTPCSDRNAVAKFKDSCLTYDDISDQHLFSIRSSFYTYSMMALKRYVVLQLAKDRKDFILKPFNPTEEEVKAHFKKYGYAAEGDLTHPAIKSKVLSDLKFLEGQRQLNDLYNKAISLGLVENYLEKPKPSFTSFPLRKRKLETINTKPDLVLVEFFDTQCSYCSEFNQTLKRFLGKYKKIAYYSMHLPLDIHEQNYFSAIALECARDQHLFHPLKEKLHQNIRNQRTKQILRYVSELGISNINQFNRCIDSYQYRQLIDYDLSVAKSIGLSQTPAMLIGVVDSKDETIKGRIYTGALSLEEIESAFSDTIKEMKL